jgi:hypothetical protein
MKFLINEYLFEFGTMFCKQVINISIKEFNSYKYYGTVFYDKKGLIGSYFWLSGGATDYCNRLIKMKSFA